MEVGAEGLRVDIAADFQVAGQRRGLPRGRDIATPVVQQHGEVPGRMGQHRVLEIQQAHPGHALAVRQPDQVFRVIVPVAEDAGRRLGPGADRRPQGLPLSLGVGREGRDPGKLRPPFQEHVAARAQGQVVIGQEGPGGALRLQHRRRRGLMQPRQHLDGGLIEGSLVGPSLDQPGIEVVAQVLQHRQALARLMGDDFGRREALAPQPAGGGHEGVHPAGRQPGHRVVAGQPPVIGTGVRRAGGGLHRRLVHEDQARLARTRQPLIAPRRGVAGQRDPLGVGQAVTAQEVGLQAFTVRTQSYVLPRRHGVTAAPGAPPRPTQSLYPGDGGEGDPPGAGAIR